MRVNVSENDVQWLPIYEQNNKEFCGHYVGVYHTETFQVGGRSLEYTFP